MKQTLANLTNAIVILVTIAFVSSCLDIERNLSGENGKLSKDQYFDFNMNQNITLDIDYCFKQSDDYVVIFELYDQDPMQENSEGVYEKKEITPIYRASTDEKGKFSGEITIPAETSEVWLTCDYPGAVSQVKLNVENNKAITFNQDTYINSFLNKKTRAVTPNRHNYTDDWIIMGDWDENGRPDYLLPSTNILPSDILYNIKDVFKKTDGYITKRHPEFFTGNMISDVKIIKPTKISMVFINSAASWCNVVGYYTYPTGTTPDANNIKKILAFPNVSPIYKTLQGLPVGALVCGDEVQLKYWDGTQFHDEFPAGVTIGWYMQGMGFKYATDKNAQKGDIINGMGPRYSTTELNSESKIVSKDSEGREIIEYKRLQRTVALRDQNSDEIVAIGFEDNSDFDYGDALFYINVEAGSVDTSSLPALPEAATKPSDKDNYTTRSGILTFEDMWPFDGDYDMNDVMIKYTSTVYKMLITNRVYKIVDEFTPYHNGGNRPSGFGYQLNKLAPSDIRSVKIEGPEASKYMEGNTLESGQTYPTILLFDNVKAVIDQKYTVTIEVSDMLESNVVAPYNPFIFVQSDQTRGQEVHMVNYPPTDKAGPFLFGTGKDASRPRDGIYYTSRDLMPFAINVPVADIGIPKEMVRIDVQYPLFRSWVESNGTKNKDWYLPKNKKE